MASSYEGVGAITLWDGRGRQRDTVSFVLSWFRFLTFAANDAITQNGSVAVEGSQLLALATAADVDDDDGNDDT